MTDIFACIGDPFGCFLNAIPAWAYWALAGFAALFVIGVLWRLKDFLALIHRIAGWPGVAGILGALGVLLAVFWPKRKITVISSGDLDPSPAAQARKPSPAKPRKKSVEEMVKGE